MRRGFDMAHRHPSLPDPCIVCDRAVPLVKLPDGFSVPADDGWTLPVIAAGIVLALILFAGVWLLFAALG